MKVIIIKGQRINLNGFKSWKRAYSTIYFKHEYNHGTKDLEIDFETDQEAEETLQKIDSIVGSTDLMKMKI